jgi:hypothetical protein
MPSRLCSGSALPHIQATENWSFQLRRVESRQCRAMNLVLHEASAGKRRKSFVQCKDLGGGREDVVDRELSRHLLAFLPRDMSGSTEQETAARLTHIVPRVHL